MAVLAKGSIVVGDGATDPIPLTVGSNTHVLTADSSTTSGLAWAAATSTFVTLATADLDMANYDIDLGTGYLSSTGAQNGVRVTGNNIYVGASSNYVNTSNVNIDGSILLTGTGTRTLSMAAPGSGAGYSLSVSSGAAASSGSDGGNLVLNSGAGNGSGDGGVTQIYAGLGGGSGATGDVELWGKVGAVAIPTLIVKGNTSKVSIQSGGATSVTPDGTLEVNQQDTGGGIPCLVLDQDDVDYAFLRLDGSAGSGTAYNLDTEPAGDTSGSTVAAPHSAAWVVVGMVKILVGTDVRYLPYYSKV